MKNFATDFVASLRSGYALPARRDEISLLQPVENPLIHGESLSKQNRPPLSATYGYDPENRMISAVSFATGQPVSSYTYDALGRRNSKTVASSGTATVYVTDPDGREILEYDGTTGATNAWYAYGPGPNDVVSRMVVGGAGVRTTMIPDIQGSIIGTLNTGILVPIGKSGYQPYGDNTTVTTGTFRYTGQRFDAETAGSPAEPSGLYYYRSRMYSPALGRFLQPDTIGYQGGMNLYGYVGNDPLNRTDPRGTCIEDLCIGEGFLVYEGVEIVIASIEAGEAAEGGVAAATALESTTADIGTLNLSNATLQVGEFSTNLITGETANALLENGIYSTGSTLLEDTAFAQQLNVLPEIAADLEPISEIGIPSTSSWPTIATGLTAGSLDVAHELLEPIANLNEFDEDQTQENSSMSQDNTLPGEGNLNLNLPEINVPQINLDQNSSGTNSANFAPTK